MGRIKKDRPGLTLIELILSIAIIGMIIVSFMPLFVMSAKNNSKSENTLNATYLGKDVMEFAYHLSNNKKVIYNELQSGYDPNVYKNLATKLSEEGYGRLDSSKHSYEKKFSEKEYIQIEFEKTGNLVRALVRVYKNEEMKEKQVANPDEVYYEVQYESLYLWEEA